MPGFFGNSECAKIAKNLSPFMAADFSLFCHGSARGGPHVPRTPLRWAGALPVALWSGGRAVGVSGYANGVIYVQATQHSPSPSVPIRTHCILFPGYQIAVAPFGENGYFHSSEPKVKSNCLTDSQSYATVTCV